MSQRAGDGLVVMLDVAGLRIGVLEGRVAELEREVVAERQQRRALEGMLAIARQQLADRADTVRVPGSETTGADNDRYATDPARPLDH